MNAIPFEEIGRLPAQGDNVAIAIRRLERGATFDLGGRTCPLSHTVLEGHRFAVAAITRGQPLTSWGLPFGTALRDIAPGEYVCNAGILDALALRRPDFELPTQANFADRIPAFEIDERLYRPAPQVPLHEQTGTFQGFARAGNRGVGTRNFIVLLGTTSLTGSFVRALEARLHAVASECPNIDGVVAVAHTEGGGAAHPNNLEFVLRTLAGFIVHPNVGACIAVDFGSEAITNAMLERYMRANGYALAAVPHRFYSIRQHHEAALEACERIVRGWLPSVNAAGRSREPLAGLKIGLQCGGSDAFSGVSGNPLAGWISRELIRHGGSASLAETDELIGAEPYVLASTRDLATAKRFLEKIAIFTQRVAWHGHSAEGNPTGGNKFRGLYNIAIKSIGAARKKSPDVRLDYVTDYAERMTEPGFYFMDSPGNDLESIAGQVASGCNLIVFTTGNGSITNFPFVPTVKVVTTTGRWNLLSSDMDVNAGRYLDGTPMDDLGREAFGYTVDVASGRRSVGERAGHAQVSIWRDWQQTDASRLESLRHRAAPDGQPIPVHPSDEAVIRNARFRALPCDAGFTIDRVGLVMPTSLCSGQIAQRISSHLTESLCTTPRGISRFVALPHTEGCGASAGENEDHQLRTMVGHLLHPFVATALLLEHGCERTHNDLLRRTLERNGLDPDRYGYASIQLDGGIEKVSRKVEHWFLDRLPAMPQPTRVPIGLGHLSLGLLTFGLMRDAVSAALARIVAGIAGCGGTVVIAENASLLDSPVFQRTLGWSGRCEPSLSYGESRPRAGVHVMATPTVHGVETLTGLGGTGVQLMLAHVQGPPLQGHPMVPVLQVTSDPGAAQRFGRDLDHLIDPAANDVTTLVGDLTSLICAAASHEREPGHWAAGCVDFQLTRGSLGVSL